MSNFKKEIEVQIMVDGRPLQGSSFIVVENGKVHTKQVEEHLYEVLRKWNKDWLKEAEDEERDSIVNNLDAAQEEILKEAHAKNYHGLDDEMSDDYDNWLGELELDELKKVLNLK